MIVDTLVVELGLDPKKFTDSQRDALNELRRFEEGAERQGRRVESQTKRLNDVLQNFKRETLSALGLFVGGYGLKEMIINISNLDASTGRFAKTLGVSARELSNWQGLFKQIGADVGSAQGALGGLNSAMVQFQLTGQAPGGLLGVLTQLGVDMFDKNRNLKAPTDVLLDIASAIERRKMSPREASGLLGLLPGMNQDMVNALLMGRKGLEEHLRSANKAGGTTDEGSKNAQEFQKNMGLLGQAATEAGRAVMEVLYPALNKIATVMRELIELSPGVAGALGVAASVLGLGAVGRGIKRLIGGGASAAAGVSVTGLAGKAIRGAGSKVLGPLGFLMDTEPAAAPTINKNWWEPYMGPGGGSAGGAMSATETEAAIRKAALKWGIDPDVAVKVWGTEGRAGYVGDAGSSFGPFQLHYGGIAPGMMQKGLGDDFTKRTGLHARDPSTTLQQIDFAMETASKKGWGQWYGWKGPAWAGIGSAGQAAGNTSTTSVQIGSIHVNAPNATDAAGVAREIGPQLRREVTAGFANAGAQ